MNQYEVMYVIDAALEDSARNELIARFSELIKRNGGTVDRIDEWGKRRLAYAINYKTEGYYVLMYIHADPQLPRELDRNFQISDKVLRSLITRYEGELPARREPLRPYAPREAAPVSAPAEESAKPAEAEPAAAAAEEASAKAEPAPEAPAAAAEEAPAEAEDDEKPESEAE